MLKGKAILTIEIDINIPENTEGILPIDQIRENLVTIDKSFQNFLDDEVLCPQDGITGRAILEEAYIDYADDDGQSDETKEAANENGFC